MPPAVHTHPTARVDTLRALRALGSPTEACLDDVAELAATVCSTPVAGVTLVDAHRSWTTAALGVAPADGPRAASLCGLVVAGPGQLLQLPDTLADLRSAGLPQVTGPPWLRFYAGAAIVCPGGDALGTVWVADHQPRRLPARSLAGLRALARQAGALLELRGGLTGGVAARADAPLPTALA